MRVRNTKAGAGNFKLRKIIIIALRRDPEGVKQLLKERGSGSGIPDQAISVFSRC